MTFQYVHHAVAAGFVFTLLAPPAIASSPEQIFVQVSPSVVVVDIVDAKGQSIGQGSGTVIGAGIVITTCHLAQGGKSQQVRQSGNTFKATIQYADTGRDLCQLSVPDLQAPPVALGTAQKLKVGQRVFSIGAPQGLELTLSEGLISSLRPYEGSQYIQTSAAISPGSSGGGLFDDQGRLIGITTFYLTEGQSLNFALPVDWLAELPKRAQALLVGVTKEQTYWFSRSMVLEQEKDWQGLLQLSQQWVKSQPGNVIAWFSLGNAYNNLEQYEQVIRVYREMLRIHPGYADAWYELSIANAKLKQYDQSIQACQEVLRIQPENAKAWYNLGVANAKLKQYKKAIQAFQESLRIQPGDADAWYNLGVTYGRDLKQYEQAIQAFRESLRIQPKDAAVWNNLGATYRYLKQYDQSIRALQESLRIRPEHADTWYNLGTAYYLQGKSDKVREVYQTLRKLDAAKADTYFNTMILPNPIRPN